MESTGLRKGVRVRMGERKNRGMGENERGRKERVRKLERL